MYFFLANGWLARQKLGVNWKEGGFEPPTSQGLSFFSFQLQSSGPWFIGWLWGAMMWHLRRRSLGWQRSNPSSSAAFASITPAGAAHGQRQGNGTAGCTTSWIAWCVGFGSLAVWIFFGQTEAALLHQAALFLAAASSASARALTASEENP